MKTELASRLIQRRKDHELTQHDLASLSGVSRMGIAKIESGRTLNARADTLFYIARALKCDPIWLLNGEGSPDFNANSSNDFRPGLAIEQRVPEISWEEAKTWSDTHSLNDKQSYPLHPSPVKCSPGAYALRVKNESMKPRFDLDDLIFVDPTMTQPIDGKYVVLSTDKSSQATFKQVQIIDSQVMLKSLNPDFPPDMRFTRLEHESQVIGTLVSHVKPV
ncbi:hypothetical protein A1OO_08785 [Enterovibrio norvegicus FF-33]|uniref:helix-turn-helix domain-containing protein n=1 Tax=Enterovibrio norvegicus TaxID=188144 RepID=UPI0003772617|nr:S24 family peptidase [Enterovibrio norvegicus]OEE65894.1 hypothetical protein A1OO_08785 [Enterovibrio norvegicus FF-33]